MKKMEIMLLSLKMMTTFQHSTWTNYYGQLRRHKNWRSVLFSPKVKYLVDTLSYMDHAVDVVLRLPSLSFHDAVSKTPNHKSTLTCFDSLCITRSFCSFLILSTSASTLWFTQLMMKHTSGFMLMMKHPCYKRWLGMLGLRFLVKRHLTTGPLVWISTLSIVCVRGKMCLTLSRLSGTCFSSVKKLRTAWDFQ